MDLSSGYTPTRDLSRATTIPSRWYTDPAFLDLERERVFWRTWQPVGHARDAAQPGQYFSCEIAGEPVIVARTSAGELKALANVCRHRASAIVSGKGQANVLRCPYHAWTYQLDGRLLGTPEFEGVNDFDRNAVCLPS